MKQFSKLMAISLLGVSLIFSSCGANRTIQGGAIGAILYLVYITFVIVINKQKILI
jgi:hypothetical protein